MNNTETYILHLYKSINIDAPEQLTIDRIATFLDIDVRYWEFTSELIHYRNRYKVFINDNLNSQQQWQDFGHEMAHFCWHGGSQHNLLQMFLNYQEHKADYFALHFCVPSFMLHEIDNLDVNKIVNIFNVEYEFAYKRLELHKNKIYERTGIYG